MESRLPTTADVAVIGAGPVGLTASLLLSQFGIQHLTVEQCSEPTDHPQAHFISCRSMEVFRELGSLERSIREASAPLDEWRHYVYCTNLYHLPKASKEIRPALGALLGATDHFPHGPDHAISPTWECNIPQHILVGLLKDAVLQNRHGRLVEGYRAEVNENHDAVRVTLSDSQTGRHHTIDCRYVVCADGARSSCRETLAIKRQRKTPVLQHLINIHFVCPDLADLLRRRIMGMLYFVYTPDGIGVFVNHSLEKGEFVLQLPFFPAYQDADSFSEAVCADLIARLVGTDIAVQIKSIRPWRLGAWVAETFQSRNGRCFLAGDAAHQVLPAGGFGLNAGIGDVHNLAWKLARALKDDQNGHRATDPNLLSTYDAERRPVATRYLDISKQNFAKTLAVSSAIGLDWEAARWLDRLVRMLPTPNMIRRKIFNFGMHIGLAQVKLLNSDNLVAAIRRKDLEKLFSDPAKILQMRFPRQDLGVVYRHGWIKGTVETDFYDSDSLELNPDWVKGARLPHLWLRSAQSGSASRISSLDLPAILSRDRNCPVHVMLIFKLPRAALRGLVDELDPSFSPVKIMRIGSADGSSKQADYVFDSDLPPDLKLPDAVLVRPDGHIAWICTGRLA